MQAATTAHVFAVCRAVHDMIDDPRKAASWAELHPRDSVDSIGGMTVTEEVSEQYSISPMNISAKISRNARMAAQRGDTASTVKDAFE